MRFSTRLFLYWVSIFLMFYVGVIAVIFFIVGMIPPGLITFYFSK
jgi:hypothetical protein